MQKIIILILLLKTLIISLQSCNSLKMKSLSKIKNGELSYSSKFMDKNVGGAISINQYIKLSNTDSTYEFTVRGVAPRNKALVKKWKQEGKYSIKNDTLTLLKENKSVFEKWRIKRNKLIYIPRKNTTNPAHNNVHMTKLTTMRR